MQNTAPSRDGGATPTPPLHFVQLDKKTATELIIAQHYLHRRCPISWAWGIEVYSEILGVLTIGKPCSWSATCGVIGEKYTDLKNPNARSKDVYELNRLWVADVLPRNTESQFIAYCLRAVKKLHPNIILISYADGKMGHIGYVYQATNWIYTGTSAAFTDITLPGYSDHRSIPKELRGDKTGNRREWSANPQAIRNKRSTKHRYVWFSSPKDVALLHWPRAPYPKKIEEKV